MRLRSCARRFAKRSWPGGPDSPLCAEAPWVTSGMTRRAAFEPVLRRHEHQPDSDDAAWMFFRTVLAFDRVQQQIEITSVVFVAEAAGDREQLRALYDQAVRETEQIDALLPSEPLTVPSSQPTIGHTTVHFQSNWPRPQFEAAVEKVKEHIAAGDCYQAVISREICQANCRGSFGDLSCAARHEPFALHVPAAHGRRDNHRVIARDAGSLSRSAFGLPSDCGNAATWSD